MTAPKWKYNEEDIQLMNDEIDRLTAENERLKEWHERLRGELNAVAMAISRWLAHQWGPQEQYAKMREARDTVKHALQQGVMK